MKKIVFHNLEPQFIDFALDKLNLKEAKSCYLCGNEIKSKGDIGGFVPGSANIICNDIECKIIARMKDLIGIHYE